MIQVCPVIEKTNCSNMLVVHDRTKLAQRAPELLAGAGTHL
jgi:hypothetical protein